MASHFSLSGNSYYSGFHAGAPEWQHPREAATWAGTIEHWEASAASVPQGEAGSAAFRCILGTAGSARMVIDGRPYSMRPHLLLWIPPGRRWVQSEVSADCEMWSATFGSVVVARVGIDLASELAANYPGQAAGYRRLTKISARRLQTQFEHLATTDCSTEQFIVGLEYLLLSAWAEQRKATRLDGLTDVHPAVEKAAHILRTQPETPSMRELARRCGASASWLSRLFREQIGVSLVGYRNQSRIERFFELYGADGRCNLTQAALAAGFGSYAQFHRVFKETLGYSPGQLKRSSRPRRQAF